MKRLRTALLFAFVAVVALAFVFEDLCDGFTTSRNLAILVAGICGGGFVGTLKERSRAPWTWAVVSSVVASFALYVVTVLIGRTAAAPRTCAD